MGKRGLGEEQKQSFFQRQCTRQHPIPSQQDGGVQVPLQVRIQIKENRWDTLPSQDASPLSCRFIGSHSAKGQLQHHQHQKRRYGTPD